MLLYDYFRSTASFRVRIALLIKDITHQLEEVHLVKDGGMQHKAAFLALNPQALVPLLVDEDLSFPISQSLNIIDYLEEKKPEPSLMPIDINDKYLAKQIANIIACDIHPLNNLRVLKYLREEASLNDEKIMTWYHHWLACGFDAITNLLEKQPRTIPLCIGDKISIADICLIPQVYNAHRFQFSLENYPLIKEIYDFCMKLPPFMKAAPKEENA